ncbi:hypothetical protein ACH5RR_029459 [Cinchona calisaya]|uniref:Pentatricopeptide repeat-containing protein n=1 Tax=Cinchona calisaya TaxID=153742 RepID=A0ABD2YRU2_9GENT
MCYKDITPNIDTCNVLIKALCEAGEAERANQVLNGFSEEESGAAQPKFQSSIPFCMAAARMDICRKLWICFNRCSERALFLLCRLTE